jgi:hypothetical protein
MALISRSSRFGRRSRRRREDGDGLRSLAFEIDGYEYIQASDELGLLRIAGRWLSPADRALGDIALVVDRDGETSEFSPLPDLHSVAPVASPAGEPWRAAFTVSVELLEDRRSELGLAVPDEPRIALPRPDEWADVQAEREAAERAEREAAERAELEEAEALAEQEAFEEEAFEAAPEESTSEVMAELMAQLEEVAELEEEMRAERLAKAAEEDDFTLEAEEHELDPAPEVQAPAPVSAERQAQLEEHIELLRSELVELTRSDDKLERVRQELATAREQLAQSRAEAEQLRSELESERRRREQFESELGSLRTVEGDLRNAVAMQEAELASAVEQEAQRARQAERRRSVSAPSAGNGDSAEARPKPADEDFLTRLDRARRASETVG